MYCLFHAAEKQKGKSVFSYLAVILNEETEHIETIP